jgi:hypothetical protein
VEVGALEVAAPGEDGLGDVRLGDADAEVVVDGPEPGLEEVAGAGRKRVRLLGGSLTPFRISLCPRAPSRPLVVVSQIWFSDPMVRPDPVFGFVSTGSHLELRNHPDHEIAE